MSKPHLNFYYDENEHQGVIHAMRKAGFIVRMEYFPEKGYARCIIAERTMLSELLLQKFGIWLNPKIGSFYSPLNRLNYRLARFYAPLRAMRKHWNIDAPIYWYICKGDNYGEFINYPDQPKVPHRHHDFFIPNIKAVYHG